MKDVVKADITVAKCSWDNLYKKWDELVLDAPIQIRKYLQYSRIDTLNDKRVVVSLKKGNYDIVASDSNRRILQKFISEIVEQDVIVELVESMIL